MSGNPGLPTDPPPGPGLRPLSQRDLIGLTSFPRANAYASRTGQHKGEPRKMSVTNTLLGNNDSYAKSFTKGDLPMPPGKKIAVLACMDARLDVNKILGLEERDAHVIRNAGGVATDDAIRSLVISQRLLATEEVVLVHHTDCGMLTFADDEVKAQIEAETGIRPPFALEAFPDLEGDVRQSIARIKASPFIPRKESVRGFVYDVRTGALTDVQ